MKDFLSSLLDVTYMIYLLLIALDIMLGVGISIKDKKFKPQELVNGIIHKIIAIFSIVVFASIDYITNLDLSFMLPSDWIGTGLIKHVGISTIFTLCYIIREFGSVIKKMRIVGLPIPSGIESIYNKYKDFISVSNEPIIKEDEHKEGDE
jgi:toxin secretion/phage lysis holin